MTETSITREAWDARVRGQDCPYCALMRDNPPFSEDSYLIATLERSRLRLLRNQYAHGACVLIATRHISEPHRMRPVEREKYFADLMRAAEAIAQVFTPMTVNYQIVANVIQHLHTHIIPRYHDDPAPGQALDPFAETVTLSDDAYRAMVGDVREALGMARVRVDDPLLEKYLDDQARVIDWPKLKYPESQAAVCAYLATKFETDRDYSEREVNELLNTWATFGDWALLRRELFNRQHLNRRKDGTAYWRSE